MQFLGSIGPEAREAVLALREAWEKGVAKQYAGEALKKIDPEAAAKVGLR